MISMSVILHFRRWRVLRRNALPAWSAPTRSSAAIFPVSTSLDSILSHLTENRDRCEFHVATINQGRNWVDLTEQSNDLESGEGREHRHRVGLHFQSRVHDPTRRPVSLADDHL